MILQGDRDSDNTLKQEQVFKIRSRETGIFSRGGSRPGFDEKGKSWSRINHARSAITNARRHLRRFMGTDRGWVDIPDPYENCEIVPFVLVEDEDNVVLVEPLRQRR